MDPSISPDQLTRRLAAVCLLDVRRAPARAASHEQLPGARWCDPECVSAWLGSLPADTPIVAYCVHGHEVSQTAVAALRAAGLDALYLQGGIEGWKAAGGALVPC